MSLKAAEVYKFRKNKNHHFVKQHFQRRGEMVWNSRNKGQYVRGAEGKTLIKRLSDAARKMGGS